MVNATSRNVALLSFPEAFILKDIPLPDTEFPVDARPAFSTDSRTLYIPSYTTGEVIAYDVENQVIKDRIAVAQGPTTISMSPDGRMLTSVDTVANELSLGRFLSRRMP